MANTKNKENAPRGFHVILHVCCFAGQHSASLFSKLCAVIHSRLIVHTWHLSAASWPLCCVYLPLFYLYGSWYSPKVGWKDLPLSSCNPSSSSSSFPLLGTRGQHRGQLLAVTRKPPPAVGLSNASRTARSRAHSEHMRVCYLRDFASFLFLTSKRRMWQKIVSEVRDTRLEQWSHDINR